MLPISCTILTKNAERTLRKTLESAAFFDEIILIDTGSDDSTISIAQEFPQVKIFEKPFIGFGPLHRMACDLAHHDWIFSLDSDEVISKELRNEIENFNFESHLVYSIPFQNILFGKKVRFSGWYPDRHIRLFHKKTTNFNEAFVHESVLSNGLKTVFLKGKIEHYSYLSISDFIRKMQIYTDLFEKQNKEKTVTFSHAFFHSAFAFFKTYFLKLGFLDGKNGFLIAHYQAQSTFYKYLKIWEKSQRL